jgi:broad specificity phosphatase PhoE
LVGAPRESEGNLADDRARDAHAERLELTEREAEVPLSAAGAEQAAALGRAWRERGTAEAPHRLLCSPYERVLQTAQQVREAAHWDIGIERDERLRERHLGLLDGFTKYGIEDRFPEGAERRARLGRFYYRSPGEESWGGRGGPVRAGLEHLARGGDERLLDCLLVGPGLMGPA